MKVITAPENYNHKQLLKIYCFLAGGITNCSNWQADVIDQLNNVSNNNFELILLNPRRENFPIDDPNAAFDQIKWEFDWLERCDIFSMFFDETSKSDQPICFYELGRNIERMKRKFPSDWEKRIVISANNNFKRTVDVVIQTKFATSDLIKVNVSNSRDKLISMHANSIKNAFNNLFL